MWRQGLTEALRYFDIDNRTALRTAHVATRVHKGVKMFGVQIVQEYVFDDGPEKLRERGSIIRSRWLLLNACF